jgi:hypothetical protein
MRRGNTLIAVLFAFLLMLAVISSVASLAFLMQRAVDNDVRRSLARDLADSCIATALAKLRESASYGSAGERIEIASPDPVDSDASAYLTFAAGDPNKSVNNVLNDGAVEGLGGEPLPPHCALLVSVAKARGVEYRRVVVVGRPPYPHVVSTHGEFESSGGLMLGALRSLDDLKDGIQVADLRRGSLMSNGALRVSGSGTVVGDLRTAASGSVVGVTHVGSLEQGVGREDVPVIKISEYDPKGKPEIIDFNAKGGAPPAGQLLNVAGLARYEGNMRLNQGLTLDGGVLYVDGDLTIAGGVRGTGAVFCTGKLTVTGGSSDLGSDSMCALVSGGDLSITGSGAESSQFRGLVYGTGDVKVSDITVVGSLVGAEGAGGRSGSMRVERAGLVYDPEAVDFTIAHQLSGFGPVFQRGIGLTLAPGTLLTPTNLYNEQTKQFEVPSLSQVASALIYHLPGKPPRTYKELTPDEMEAQDSRIQEARNTMAVQIEDWNNRGLSPETYSTYRLDLNRFVKVQSQMRVLARQFQRI